MFDNHIQQILVSVDKLDIRIFSLPKIIMGLIGPLSVGP